MKMTTLIVVLAGLCALSSCSKSCPSLLSTGVDHYNNEFLARVIASCDNNEAYPIITDQGLNCYTANYPKENPRAMEITIMREDIPYEQFTCSIPHTKMQADGKDEFYEVGDTLPDFWIFTHPWHN